MSPFRTPSIGVVAVLFGLTSGGNAEENRRADALAADLAFNFTCSATAEPPSAMKIERFLEDRGFRVLDIVRAAQEQHVPYARTLNIVALDAKRREITFEGFPFAPGLYDVGLYSPPPTRHDADLEGALIDVVTDQLRCEVSQISRNENSDEVGPFYDEIFKQAEGWFKEVDEMKRPKP